MVCGSVHLIMDLFSYSTFNGGGIKMAKIMNISGLWWANDYLNHRKPLDFGEKEKKKSLAEGQGSFIFKERLELAKEGKI